MYSSHPNLLKELLKKLFRERLGTMSRILKKLLFKDKRN